MKRYTRKPSRSRLAQGLSLLLAILTAFGSFGLPTAAGEGTWTYGDTEVAYFTCDSCGEVYDEEDDQEPGFCVVCGDSETYCDSCFCDACNRCEEHCICSSSFDDPAEFNSDDLELPESPAADIETAEERATMSLPEVPTFPMLELDSENKYPKETWRLFEPLCKQSDEEACIAAMKKELPMYMSVRMLDSAFVSRVGTTSVQVGHIRALASNPRIKKTISEKMNWAEGDVSYNTKVACISLLVEELKKQAIKQGLDADWVNMIQVVEKAPHTPEAVMELSESEDDDILYEIRINPDLVATSKDGYFIAQAIAHEFQHGINHIYSFGTRSRETWNLRLTSATTAGQIRQQISDQNYSAPDLSLRGVKGKENQYVISLISYLAQLEERTANEAEYELHKQYKPDKVHPSQYIYDKYGYEILPVAMSYINALSFDDQSTSYLAKLAAAVPELGLLAGDVAFSKLPLVPANEAVNFLNTNGPDHLDLLCRVNIEGKEYILPTRDLFDWAEAKSGSAPFDWAELVKLLGPQKELSNADGSTKNCAASRSDYYASCALTMADIPAEVIVFLDSVEAGLRLSEELDEAGSDLETELNALKAALEAVQEEMSLFDELEDALSELEEMADNAESLQDQLADLLSEYESYCSELEAAYETMLDELESAADDINDEMENALENTDDDMGADDLEALYEELKAEYEATVTDCQDNIDSIGDELEAVAEQIEALSDELEALADEMEMKSEEAEEMADELEELASEAEELEDKIEKLEALLQSGRAADALDRSYRRMMLVKVTDSEGSPVIGIPVYYSRPGRLPRLAGKTGPEGVLEVGITADEYYHWSIVIGPNGSVAADAEGYYYKPLELTDEYLKAVVFEDEMVFALAAELQLEFADGASEQTASTLGGLHIVLRTTLSSEAHLKIYPKHVEDRPFRVLSWVEYFDAEFTEDDIYDDGIIWARRWKKQLTENMTRYYGAHLISLDSNSEMPCVSGNRFFFPLFRVEGGKPVSNLTVMDDFAAPGSIPLPYTSYGFDMKDIPAGHYMLAVLLPLGQVHFEEVTVIPGQTLKISAEEWSTNGCTEENERRFRKLEINSDVRDMEENPLSVRFDYPLKTPIFALSVDAAGKTVWSVAELTKEGNFSVPVGISYKDTEKTGANAAETVTSTACRGQVYLIPDLNLNVRLLPIHYQYRFRVYTVTNENGKTVTTRHLDSLEAGQLYAISEEEAKKSLPVYLMFWEEYVDANGITRFRTANGRVDFELRYTKDRSAYGGVWAFEKDLRLDVTNIQSSVATVDSHLYQRLFPGSGASYTLQYKAPNPDLLQNLDLNDIIGSLGAVRLSLNDGGYWRYMNPENSLTGTATILRSERVDGERKTTRLTTEAIRTVTSEGIVLQFIFEGACSDRGHRYELSSTDATCTKEGTETFSCVYCGATRTETVPAAGHLEPGVAGKDYIVATGANTHARYCLRCGELVDEAAHTLKQDSSSKINGIQIRESHCEVCGAEIVTREKHTKHDLKNYRGAYGEYDHDEKKHWRICATCGESVGEKHNFVPNPTGTKVCAVCGYETAWNQTPFATANTDYLCPHQPITVSFNKNDPYYGQSFTKYGFDIEWYGLQRGIKKVLATNTKTFSLTDALLKQFQNRQFDNDVLWFRASYGADTVITLRFRYARPTVSLSELPSTCLEQGYAAHLVCYCGGACNADGSAMEDWLYPLADHSFSDDCDEYCNVCGAYRELEHPFSAEWQHYGDYHYRECTGCAHITDFGLCGCSDWIIDTAPDCSTSGSQRKVCPMCLEEKASEEIPAGHEYAVTEFTEPDCEKEGSFTETCALCGDTAVSVMPKTEHTLQAVPESVAPDGKTVIPAHYVCEDCAEKTVDRKGRVTLDEYMLKTKDFEAYQKAMKRGGGNTSVPWWFWLALAVLAAVTLWLSIRRSKQLADERRSA